MQRKRTSQAPVLIVYVITMLISLALFGAVALVLLEVFVTQPKLARLAAADSGVSEDADASREPDYSLARETILFIGADGDNINGMALVRVLPDLLSVKIVPISPYTYSQVGGTEGTIASLYDAGGMTYLKSGVENAMGVKCDKYIKITNDGWKSFVEYLGGTNSYYFPQDIYYKNEDTGEITSFSQGSATRTLYGDDIRRIITYPLYDNGNEARVQVVGELTTSLVNSACTYNSGSVISNIQSIFNILYNNSDSDITSRSFASVRDAYEYLIQNSTSPATYRLPSGSWDSRGYFNVDGSFKSEIETYFEMAVEQNIIVD